MPIYEYRCQACGHEFEALLLPASAAPVCTSCNSPDLERLLSGFAVSSEGSRNTNLRAAKTRAAANRDQRDKRIADQEVTREHFEENGIVLPPHSKPTE